MVGKSEADGMMNAERRTTGKWGVRIVFLAALLAVPIVYSKVVASKPQDPGAQTLLGNYLAGRIARQNHDTDAAADFYNKALERDPKNEAILEQAFLLAASAGQWKRATKLANALIKVEPSHRFAQFLLGINAFERADYKKADAHFAAARQGPIADLASTLARAWVQEAEGEHSAAFKRLDALSNADWAQYYQRYHRALIADVAGRHQLASKSYDSVFKRSPATLRIADAYARHAARSNRQDLAIATLKMHMAKTAPHPITEALLEEIETGDPPSLIVKNPTEGLAEVFYGIGEAVAGDGGIEMGIIYLKFALHLKPNFPMAQIALAEAYSQAKKYEAEISAFDTVPPSSPLWVNVQIQKAFALTSLERVDEAKELLEEIIAQNPDDIRPLDALGNIMRSKERYEEARTYYDRAIKLVDEPTKQNWALYYSRGVTNERLKDWPAAETDFNRALELNPDESLVLNYLGYSWVDQGMNLEQAMDYIRKAVSLKPDDGYYVDSLGWAHYRLGNMQQAVEHLERAVELRPDDPIINDHLASTRRPIRQ
ncbi:MAG: tetratricopeptide repeat protein [Pseudomonadota bacterium]